MLQEMGVTDTWIYGLDEVYTKGLYLYILGALKHNVRLTEETAAESAETLMKEVVMHPGSGPDGADKFVTLWIPLHEAPPESGTLFFASGSQFGSAAMVCSFAGYHAVMRQLGPELNTWFL